jgi:hypothetical protein
MGAGPEIGQLIQPGAASAVITLRSMAWLAGIATSSFRSLKAVVPAAVDTKDKQYDRSSC